MYALQLYIRTLSLSMILLLNGMDRQGLYGFSPLKNNGTIAFPSNSGHISISSKHSSSL